MRISFYTLGCKVNQNETGALQQLFADQGHTICGPEDEADVFIVNSCTVTSGGDRKSRSWLRRVRRRCPEAVTVLTGCYPQAFPEEAARIPEADIVTGSTNRAGLPEAIRHFCATHDRIVDIVPHQKDEVYEELPIDTFAGHTRAFVKVEDGCNRRCAYCVIPRARGPVRSRSIEDTVNELRALAASGYTEAVLSGINLPSYGADNGIRLIDLIEACAQVPGIRRLRLGSLEPDLLTDDDITRLAAVPTLCPQFHMSLQSGCTRTLRNMRRTYTAEMYTQTAEKLTKAFNGHLSFTTDIIVGFPGETQEDFEESMRYVSQLGFLKVHVFPFSPRKGTPAAEFENQIPQEIKNQRVKVLQAEADRVRSDLITAMKGQCTQVLLETEVRPGVFSGYTRRYVPVTVKAPGHRTGQIVEGILGQWDGETCAVSLAD